MGSLWGTCSHIEMEKVDDRRTDIAYSLLPGRPGAALGSLYAQSEAGFAVVICLTSISGLAVRHEDLEAFLAKRYHARKEIE